MRSILPLFYFIVLFLFISTTTYSTDHYVDKNASGQNNGSSWTNAWESFSAINWNIIQPGDIIYISGGTDSTVYYERLYIGNVQGTAANPITIKNSYDAGHNGRVIIDGSNGARDCILIGNSDGYSTNYITISGLELREGGKCIWVHNRAKSLIFDSLTVTNWTINGLLTQGTTGVPEAIDGVTIQNSNWIGVPLGEGEDCLQFNSSSNHIIRNNFIHQRNSKRENNHVDGILGMWSEGYKVYNNVIIVDSNAQGQAVIIRAWADGANEDSVIIYNNFMYQGGIWDSNEFPWTSVLNLRWQAQPPNVKPPTLVAHNTIVSNGRYVQGVVHEVPSTFVNNIVAQFGDGVTPSSSYWLASMRGTTGDVDADSVRNNIIWREYEPGSSPMFTGTWYGNGTSASNFGWSTWTGTLGGTGINANPLFVDQIGYIGDQSTLDGELQSGSPAINAGEDIQALIESMGLPWTDINGNPRDNTPTIGAYEYDSGPDLTPPEVTGATLLDSVTLVINFSESLDATTAEDENNYSISNNVDVFNASLSGRKVTLQTSTHLLGINYTVTVINVEDLAGNAIAQNNTAEYEYIVIPPDSLIMFLVENVEGIIVEPEHTPEKTIDGLGALDGDPHSRWAAEPMPEELIFDLGSNKTVCKTRLSFYNWNAGRVYNYSISISNDNNNWTTVIPQATSASNQEWTIDEFSPVDARYVMVHFINNNQSDWAGLWEGEIWGIEREGNNPPNQPSNPSPSNGTTNQQIDLNLSWSCTDPDFDPLTFDVYFGPNSNPPLVSIDQSISSFDPGQLENITIYYWKIVAKDNQGSSTSGPVWNFTTEVVGTDTIPPELVNAVLINTTTLELTFTEPVDSVLALHLSNYTISNDINIQDALISDYKDVVTLITDNHTNGITYSIVANNIYDLSGNLISEQHNSIDYTCITDSVAPEFIDVIVQNNKTLTVNFSERVDYNSASNKNNYSISNNIVINNVQVLPDSCGAMLKTSRQGNNSDYLITVSNIKDRAGNNLNPNPSSKSYRTRKKGKGNSRQNPIEMGKSNSWFQFYTPDKTIDGKGMTYPDSRWQSDNSMPVDIIFDLGKSQSFDSLRISYYKWETGKMFQYSVYTSLDSINWIPAVEEMWSENSEWTELNIDSVETRYMKLLLVKSNQGPFASIWEVEMYGTENNSSGEEINSIPYSFELSQNYPNPFNPKTSIRYSVPQPSQIQIKIYDIIGNEIETLINEYKQIGNYEVEFSAVNLPSGVYFYQLKTETFVETMKMILMK